MRVEIFPDESDFQNFSRGRLRAFSGQSGGVTPSANCAARATFAISGACINGFAEAVANDFAGRGKGYSCDDAESLAISDSDTGANAEADFAATRESAFGGRCGADFAHFEIELCKSRKALG